MRPCMLGSVFRSEGRRFKDDSLGIYGDSGLGFRFQDIGFWVWRLVDLMSPTHTIFGSLLNTVFAQKVSFF